jgi:uncharacterized protein YkwD
MMTKRIAHRIIYRIFGVFGIMLLAAAITAGGILTGLGVTEVFGADGNVSEIAITVRNDTTGEIVAEVVRPQDYAFIVCFGHVDENTPHSTMIRRQLSIRLRSGRVTANFGGEPQSASIGHGEEITLFGVVYGVRVSVIVEGLGVEVESAYSPASTSSEISAELLPPYASENKIVPIILYEATLFTNEELSALTETAPSRIDTRSAITIPSRRITDEELEEWKQEYKDLGGINSFELEVIRLINEIRIDHGLNPLPICPNVSMAARFHSQDMIDNQFFAHFSPAQGSVMFRFLRFTGDFGLENIHGSARCPERAVNAFMNSPGHRAAILNSLTVNIGVGAVGRTTVKFGFYNEGFDPTHLLGNIR